ncbi:reverse transcriptase domain-containing protein [Tanacetum coccineum]
MSRSDVAGRLQKWSVMLREHNITYRPRTSVKGQILADFLIEKPDENLPETLATDIPQEPPEGTEFTYALRFQFTASNNEAEYEALIAGLRIAAHMGVRNVPVSVDSKLVANQVLGAYVAKEQNMIKYLEKVKCLVLVEILKEKSIHEEEVVTVVEEEGTTWMTSIIEYLKDGTLPGDRKEVSKLRIKARQYELLEGVLYKRSFLKPWLWMEAVIPVEIRMPTYRTADVDTVHNDEELRLNWIYWKKSGSAQQSVKPMYEVQTDMSVRGTVAVRGGRTRQYEVLFRWRLDQSACDTWHSARVSTRVRGVAFRPGDFVYRSNDASHATAGGKLGPKWEGPYEVTKALGDGAYKLSTMTGADLPRTWNIANQKKCYL